ncbi:MAG: methyltransferase domain-containing protein, partial [Lysobacter sp.]|nr:methyltransferase domain-containing protein [Lysobacter sp.]
LSQRFGHVHASDPSSRQLAAHWSRDPAQPGAERVVLAATPAENPALGDASVELVAVAQALHWFDRVRFFAQCRRVLAPGGVLAAWGYRDFLPPEGMTGAVASFRAQIEPHWPSQRDDVDAQYAGYDWPFEALPAPELWLETEWSLPQFLRYLASMSASARCQAATGDDAVARHGAALAAAWGDPARPRILRWPLFLHLRRKP